MAPSREASHACHSSPVITITRWHLSSQWNIPMAADGNAMSANRNLLVTSSCRRITVASVALTCVRVASSRKRRSSSPMRIQNEIPSPLWQLVRAHWGVTMYACMIIAIMFGLFYFFEHVSKVSIKHATHTHIKKIKQTMSNLLNS